jgi:arylformamidase
MKVSMTQMIDISWPISNEMTTYKDKKDVVIKSIKEFHVDGVREIQICMGSHTGTHVDAPAHFLENGETVDFILLEKLIGECQVIDMTDVNEKITVQDLQKIKITSDILLFKTKNSFLSPISKFDYEFIYLDASAAYYLIENFNLKSIGIDYLGIERDQPAHLTHTVFLESGIPIIEGLRLQKAEAKKYKLICMPLLIEEADAAPARACLIEI